MHHVLRRRAAGFTGTLVLLQIHLLLLVAPPESFREDVVHATPPSVHADSDTFALGADPVDIEGARVLASLIAVDDPRTGDPEGVLQRLDHESRRERIRKGPRDHVPRIPVQKHRQIHEAALEPHIGHVGSPRVVRMVDGHPPQKIGKLRTLAARAQSRTGVYRQDAHVSHETLNPLARYGHPSPGQRRLHPPGTVAWLPRMNLVDPSPEQQLFFR
ncbi:hypothetical protein SDC9_137547 [bioreactor metagenome]|uniref:Uncharacterized protein n=1 Tax=bioreactor metagenome TaxID=1076179 RepID=A0A645DM68_9ZZZZ